MLLCCQSTYPLTFAHPANNMHMCHFRRLHLSMIFRRRFLKHLIVESLECHMLERFVDVSQNKPHPRCTLHGYILQMLWDISTHDQRHDEEDEEEQHEEAKEPEQLDSVVINDDGG